MSLRTLPALALSCALLACASRDAARDWLMRYALASPERATQRMAFIDTYLR